MKARKAKVTPLHVRVPSAYPRGERPTVTTPTEWPRIARVDIGGVRVTMILDGVTRAASYNRHVRLYHATALETRGGLKKGERAYVDIRACTWIDDAEKDAGAPSAAARRRARRRRAQARGASPKAAAPRGSAPDSEFRMPTLLEQGATFD